MGSRQFVLSDASQAAAALQLYMASSDSSGLSAFLRLGVPCTAPGSPLGGDISAALALSSRNLSNSGRRRMKRERLKRGRGANSEVGVAKGRTGRKIKAGGLSPYLHWSPLPRRHLPSVEQQRTVSPAGTTWVRKLPSQKRSFLLNYVEIVTTYISSFLLTAKCQSETPQHLVYHSTHIKWVISPIFM